MSAQPNTNSVNVARTDRHSALVEQVAAQRDSDAFSELFRYYAPRIVTMVTRRGGDDNAANEIAQDSLLQLWRRATQFDRSRGQVSAWIYTIARNAYIDRVRSQRSFEHTPDTDVDIAAGDSDVEAQFMKNCSAQILRAALEKLPPEQYKVITTSYWQGKSLGDIAIEQKLPLGTVKTRARLALKKLRELLGETPEQL